MNGTTILIWINIVIVALIAIIIVKIHYRKDKLDTDENKSLQESSSIGQMLNSGIEKIKESASNLSNNKPSSNSLNNSYSSQPSSLRKEGSDLDSFGAYIVPEVENNEKAYANVEYESTNQVLVDYGSEVKKFQEPIKQSQMDIMNQSNQPNENKHELKDLFTIDELIKESKRKDNEREKESKRINKDAEDSTDIKESIKMKKENKAEETLIEKVSEEESIADIINDESSETETEKADEIESSISQKDISDAIESASKESEEEIEDISEKESITDVLLDSEEETLKTPTLKSPLKVSDKKDGVSILSGEDEDYKFGGQLEDSELFNDDDEMNDLDYRKDLAKFTNTIKNSKILQDVKERFAQDEDVEEEEFPDETYIRNVNEYDEFAPIINETHTDYEGDYESYHSDEFDTIDTFDEKLREENTIRIQNMQKASKPKVTESAIPPIKEKPSRDNIKITLNNTETVLKKGDEIIFKHDGETYSSQVYSINGDDISVKYRRKNITIKPSDVKKIY